MVASSGVGINTIESTAANGFDVLTQWKLR
jgi:hypothetical protein